MITVRDHSKRVVAHLSSNHGLDEPLGPFGSCRDYIGRMNEALRSINLAASLGHITADKAAAAQEVARPALQMAALAAKGKQDA